MICDSCKDKPLARGIKRCSTIGCKNMTYTNFTICDDCSEKSGRCARCGQSVKSAKPKEELATSEKLNFVASRVEENRQHVLWHEGVTPSVTADFQDGVIIIKSEGNTKMELLSFERGSLFVVDEKVSLNSATQSLVIYVTDDNELKEVLDGTHRELYSRVEELKQWTAYYIEGNSKILLGGLKSPYLSEAIKELEENAEHIADLIRLQKRNDSV